MLIPKPATDLLMSEELEKSLGVSQCHILFFCLFHKLQSSWQGQQVLTIPPCFTAGRDFLTSEPYGEWYGDDVAQTQCNGSPQEQEVRKSSWHVSISCKESCMRQDAIKHACSYHTYPTKVFFSHRWKNCTCSSEQSILVVSLFSQKLSQGFIRHFLQMMFV